MRPFFVILRFLIHTAFSVPMNMLDRRIAKKHEERLVRDVEEALPFLFTELNGHVVPSEGVPFPPAFDFAFVTVALDRLLFRFSRGRGQFAVQVAPSFAPSDWHELGLVLSAISGNGEIERQQVRDL